MKWWGKVLVICILMAGGSIVVQAQGDMPEFEQYGVLQGLSQSSVNRIYQDHDHFLWFPTSDGLNRFDGRQFTVFQSKSDDPKTISNNWVLGIILEDNLHNLWILTLDKVINKLDLTNFEVTRLTPDSANASSFVPFDELYDAISDEDSNNWFATDKGVCKYLSKPGIIKRYPFTRFFKPQVSRVTKFFITADNTLLAATDKGLFRYVKSADRFEQVKSYGIIGGQPEAVHHIFKDALSRNWIIGKQHIGYFDEKQGHVTYYPLPTRTSLSVTRGRCLDDQTGSLWIGTPTGLIRFDKRSLRSTLYSQSQVLHSISNSYITRIFTDSNHNLWVGTKNGVNRFNYADNSFITVKTADKNPQEFDVFDMAEDKAGNMYILAQQKITSGWKLFRFNAETNSLQQVVHDDYNPSGIPTDYVSCLFKDSNQNLWLGTFEAGVARLISSPKKFNAVTATKPGTRRRDIANIWGFTETPDGKIYFSAINSGIMEYNSQTRKITKAFSIPPTDKPTSYMNLASDKRGSLWISAFGNGLINYWPSTGKTVYYKHNPANLQSIASNNVRSVVVDKAGMVWVAHVNKGLDRIDPVKGTVTHIKLPLPNSDIWWLYHDTADSSFWISMTGSVHNYQPKTGNIKTWYQHKGKSNRLPANTVLSFARDEFNNLWMGTSGEGLCMYNEKRDSFEVFNDKNGLANNVVYGILSDGNGSLWLSTNKGISRFDLASRTFKNFDITDGLQHNEFNMGAFFKSSDGRMFFGGINGFNAFYPHQIMDDTLPPRPAFTGFRLFNKPLKALPSEYRKFINPKRPYRLITVNDTVYLPGHITYSKRVELAYHQNIISIEFSALTFEKASKTRFKYRMEGVDKDWITESDVNIATYTNLSPGNYIFKLMAANADGYWNAEPLELLIIIRPPFWQTGWFVALLGLLVGLSLWLFIRMRERSFLLQKRLLEKQVATRTREIAEQNEELELRNQQILKQKEELALQASQLRNELVMQHKTGELAMLRAQVNPHFLFNTLNGIYTLVHQKSEEAPDAVMRLAEIMRYMLYDATSEKVPLDKELRYLDSFIELQKLRLQKDRFVEFVKKGTFNHVLIPPMLLIPFVENAFKHGAKRGIENGINILLEVENNKLNFEVSNALAKSNGQSKDQTGGIGLANVQRRLELLYPNRHSLNIEHSEAFFKVRLTIDAL